MFDELGERVVLVFVGSALLYTFLLQLMDFLSYSRFCFTFSNKGKPIVPPFEREASGRNELEAHSDPEALKIPVPPVPVSYEVKNERRRLKLD
jgi:hypothetical protein